MRTWKDPDTGVTHAIALEESKEQPRPVTSALLHTLSIDKFAKRFFRRVMMRCGQCVQLDSDEFILPQGQALLQVPPPILRPWLVSNAVPTCVACVVAKFVPMKLTWGGDFGGT